MDAPPEGDTPGFGRSPIDHCCPPVATTRIAAQQCTALLDVQQQELTEGWLCGQSTAVVSTFQQEQSGFDSRAWGLSEWNLQWTLSRFSGFLIQSKSMHNSELSVDMNLSVCALFVAVFLALR